MNPTKQPINKKAYLINALFYIRNVRNHMRGQKWTEAKSWLNDAETDITQAIEAINRMPTVVK